MKARTATSLATFLALVPVTLLVPGTHELVGGLGGGTSDAHAFMTVNMVAGMLTVPVAMHLHRCWFGVRLWVVAALVIDALAFAGMGFARNLPMLYAFRVLDGAVHLSAVTLLMVASNRASGEHRGGSLGALATAIMVGVAIGSPVGGWLVERSPSLVYGVGSLLLLGAAGVAACMRELPETPAASRESRYAWNRRSLRTWIPLGYGFLDRFSIGIFVSTFTLFLREVHGMSASSRGALIALFMIPFALLCYPAGRLADKAGWFRPMLAGNILFGIVFASYGVVPTEWLPVAMIASGVLSALMFTPNLLLISDLAQRGEGEGLFGAFQVAGSLGFLIGPIVGGILVASTRGGDGAPAYREIFAMVALLEFALAAVSWVTLRTLSRERASERELGRAAERGGEHAVERANALASSPDKGGALTA